MHFHSEILTLFEYLDNSFHYRNTHILYQTDPGV